LTGIKTTTPEAAHDGLDPLTCETPMNKQQTETLKQQLQAERQSLVELLKRLRGGDVDRTEASQVHFGLVEDSREQAATDRELEFAMDEHETAAIRAIDVALTRIENGIYGECADCGVDIPVERLQASPQALCCIKCQEKRELAEPAT